MLYWIYLSILEHKQTIEQMTIVFYMIHVGSGRLQTSIPGYTCSHHLCITQWASNLIYLSPVVSNVKEKNGDISLLQIRKPQSPHHPPHRDYLHPKNSTRITWTHSYFYWISFSTGYTLPYLNTFAQKYLDIPIKGVSRGLGGKGGPALLS